MSFLSSRPRGSAGLSGRRTVPRLLRRNETIRSGFKSVAPKAHEAEKRLLGRVIESEAVESLAVSGGILGLLAGVELALAAAVLGMGAGGGLQVLLLLGWVAGTGFLGWRYVRQR